MRWRVRGNAADPAKLPSLGPSSRYMLRSASAARREYPRMRCRASTAPRARRQGSEVLLLRGAARRGEARRFAGGAVRGQLLHGIGLSSLAAVTASVRGSVAPQRNPAWLRRPRQAASRRCRHQGEAPRYMLWPASVARREDRRRLKCKHANSH